MRKRVLALSIAAMFGGIYIPRPLVISVPVLRPTGHKEST